MMGLPRLNRRTATGQPAGRNDEQPRADVLRLVDIAGLLGISKQRADQLRHDPSFPPPSARYARGSLWSKSDVQPWVRQYRGGTARWGARVRGH